MKFLQYVTGTDYLLILRELLCVKVSQKHSVHRIASLLLLWAVSFISTANAQSCSYSEGQFLFDWYGEQIYAHYYNGVLYASYQNPSEGFKPQNWLQATGKMANSFGCFTQDDPHSSSTGGNTSNPPTTTTPNPPSSGNCAFSEGQFLLSWYGEQIYAHYANGILYASYQNPGDGFKPQSWLLGTGFDPSKASCFAVNNPLTSTPIPLPPPVNNPTPNPPSGTCAFSEGQFLLNWYGEQIYAHYYNGVLYASYQDGNVGFKPRSWLTDAGYDASLLTCFAQDDPHTTTTTNPPTNPNPPAHPAPSSSAQAGDNLVGSLDVADCNGISGWIVNKNTPSKSTKLDVYINGWLVAVDVPATLIRQDVANALGISGYNAFGFYVPIQKALKQGSTLNISVKYHGMQTDIPGSPRTTAACPANPFGCSNDGSGRIAQAESNTYSRTDGLSLRLSGSGSDMVSSLTSKLLPVKKGDSFSLDTYAYAPVLSKSNHAPQITAALLGGIVAGVSLTQQQNTLSDLSHRSSTAIPSLGVSSALMIPLVKSLLEKSLPNASVEVAFYNHQGRFVHRQQVNIAKKSRLDWQLLHVEGYAKESGYVAVRLKNSSRSPVWFDDFSFRTVRQLEANPFSKSFLYLKQPPL